MLRRAWGPRLTRILERARIRQRITRSAEKGAATVLAAALAPSAGAQASGEAASAGESAGMQDGGGVQCGGSGSVGDGGRMVVQAPPSKSADSSGSGGGGGVSDAGLVGKAGAGAGRRTRRRSTTYYVNGAPAGARAQSAESLSLDAARVTWSEVLSDVVLPATMAVDMTRKTKGVDTRDLRFALYAYEQGWRVDGDGQLEALV